MTLSLTLSLTLFHIDSSVQLDDYAAKITELQDQREDDEDKELKLQQENESLKEERAMMQYQMNMMQREIQELTARMSYSAHSTPTTFPTMGTGSFSSIPYDVEDRRNSNSLDRESVEGKLEFENFESNNKPNDKNEADISESETFSDFDSDTSSQDMDSDDDRKRRHASKHGMLSCVIDLFRDSAKCSGQ